MNLSNERLCMPPLDVEFALEALKELLRLDADWVPRSKGASLYIRPNIIATGVSLGVKVSPTYLYYVILSPVGAYYKEGFAPTRILVTDEHVRSVFGGVGAAKTGGNYAASLQASELAHKGGFSQVLYLDGATRTFVEEVGTSNMFMLFDDTLVTPALSGTILAGITRDSVLAIARGWGLKVEERPVKLAEVTEGVRSGRLKEAFASGTAAVISPVGELGYRGEVYRVGDGGVGPLALRLNEELTGIQWGERPDTRGWIERL
jgi:branched-chain amino acid aminotransferase